MNPMFDALEDLGADPETPLETRFMGDEDVYIECLGEFLTDPSMNSLITAVAHQDDETATRAVHTLKGLADTLGLLPLLDEALDMLRAYRAGEGEKARAMLPAVKSQYNAFTDVIRENL